MGLSFRGSFLSSLDAFKPFLQAPAHVQTALEDHGNRALDLRAAICAMEALLQLLEQQAQQSVLGAIKASISWMMLVFHAKLDHMRVPGFRRALHVIMDNTPLKLGLQYVRHVRRGHIRVGEA